MKVPVLSSRDSHSRLAWGPGPYRFYMLLYLYYTGSTENPAPVKASNSTPSTPAGLPDLGFTPIPWGQLFFAPWNGLQVFYKWPYL